MYGFKKESFKGLGNLTKNTKKVCCRNQKLDSFNLSSVIRIKFLVTATKLYFPCNMFKSLV